MLGVYNGHEFFIVDLKETFSNVINSCEQDIVKYFQECRDSIENMKQSTLDATYIDIDTSDVLSFLKSVGGYFVFVPKVLYYFSLLILSQ